MADPELCNNAIHRLNNLAHLIDQPLHRRGKLRMLIVTRQCQQTNLVLLPQLLRQWRMVPRKVLPSKAIWRLARSGTSAVGSGSSSGWSAVSIAAAATALPSTRVQVVGCGIRGRATLNTAASAAARVRPVGKRVNLTITTEFRQDSDGQHHG
jgi:hypothetical protein